MIKGTKIELGGEEYVCPPLCLDDAQEMLPRLRSFDDKELTPEKFSTVKDVVFAALKRNYPNLTIEEIGRGLDLGNVREVLDAVLGVSGFKKATASGEAAGAAS